jgi:hypothetical protein
MPARLATPSRHAHTHARTHTHTAISLDGVVKVPVAHGGVAIQLVLGAGGGVLGVLRVLCCWCCFCL